MSVTADPRMAALPGGLCGALLWVMANYSAVAVAPKGASAEEIRTASRKLLTDSLFAVVAGGIAGYYLAPAFISWRGIADEYMRGAIGLATGLGCWPGIPATIKWIGARGEKIRKALS